MKVIVSSLVLLRPEIFIKPVTRVDDWLRNFIFLKKSFFLSEKSHGVFSSPMRVVLEVFAGEK